MNFELPEPQVSKPLAGTCQHHWQQLKTPFYRAQWCELCKLYRYKAAPAADWEYRAPIPRAPVEAD